MALRRRMDALLLDLQVIGGMTKRGAVLPPEYMIEAYRRYALRVLDALERRAPVTHPWDATNAA